MSGGFKHVATEGLGTAAPKAASMLR